MAETSKNKIYYNDDENSVADVLTDMKKLAQSTDDAIEKSKYNDTQIKKDISNMKTEIAAKDNEQDNKILQLQNEKAELEKELKEAQEDFYQNSIRGQARGEYIHVEDSSNCRAKIGIGGNSEQETRSGKNMLELIEGTYSNNGITAVVKNGIVTLNGTATGTSFVGINLLKSIELTNDKVYHVSAFNEKTVGDSTNYCSLRLNQNNIQVLFNTANVNGSITTNLKISYITIRTAQGITYNNFVVKPQLELGAGTNEWEQGGVSPSPDYQSPVKTVGSNVNIFDLESYYNIVPSANCTKQLLKNGIRLNFTAGNDAYIGGVYNIGTTMAENQKAACIKVKPNTTYTIQMSSAPKCYISYLDSNYTGTRAYTAIYNNYSKYIMTFTTNETTEYIHIRLGLGSSYGGTTYTFTDIKLEEGTTPTPYTPYGQGCINEVVCNKNVLNKDKLDKTYFSIDSNDNITSLVADNRTFTNIEAIANVIEGKKYTLSCENIVTGSIQIAYTLDNIVIDRQYNTKKISFTAPKTGSIAFKILNVTYPYVLGKIQIEEGIETTDYIEHQSQTYTIPTQQPMRSVEDTRDTFVKVDGKWIERHNVNRIIFDGTENWAIDTFNNLYRFNCQELPDLGYTTRIDKINSLCNIAHSPKTTEYVTENNCFLLRYINDTNRIDFVTDKFTKVDEWNAYLAEQYNAGTPVYIDYILGTPLDIECTEEQSQILEELNNARTYKNVTNIYSTDEISPIIDLDYAKDLETLLNNTQALAVNNASEGV